jgi:hypothetical protein
MENFTSFESCYVKVSERVRVEVREKRVTSASLLPSIRQNDYSITIEVLVELVKQLVVMGILEVITTFYLTMVGAITMNEKRGGPDPREYSSVIL